MTSDPEKKAIMDIPSTVDSLDHPAWCEPTECTAAGANEFHPETSPPAHWSSRYDCNPNRRPGRYPTEVAIQLVRFVDDPPQTDFVRVELGGFEERRSHYLRLDQGSSLRDALATLLTQAGAAHLMPGVVPTAERPVFGQEPGA
ncbi:hypothetical protein ACN27F_10230 [Solwaraspora sp. WMMB335]|uniref:hypothetical protein n=1 Tax=Solwaraspora sp. WMMB335 TaxID=3404118 RepID=UPI003B96108D